MRRLRVRALLSLLVLFSSISFTYSQKSADVPHVIRYSGTLKNVDGSPRVGTVGVTFSIYADDTSTAPLWQEVQNVIADDTGHYTVLLGVARSEGLPDGLFATNEARWLAVRVENEQEQPRAILAAVPYALKAADAETLGGKPLSAFVLNDATSGGATGTSGSSSAGPSGTNKSGLQPLSVNTSSSGGTQNQVAKWTDAGGTILGNSLLTDTGTAVGLNNAAPSTALDVSGTIRAVLSPAAPFGTYLMPTGGAANSFRFGFGNNLYFDGTNWRTKGDGANNAGSGILTDIGTGALSIYTLPSTGATDQTYSDSAFNAFEKMRVSPTGNVGINNTSPATMLDVGGTIRAVLGAGAPFGTYLMPTGGAANSFRFGFGNNLYFDGTNWRTKGDGAHNAGSGLLTDIANGQMSFFALPSTGATDQVISDTNFNNFEVMRIVGNGNVGIGTTNPAQKLDVSGNISASGNVAATGTISGSNLSATGVASFTGTPSGSGVGQGALYVNPASASAGQTLLGVAVGGVQKMLVDAGGNLTTAGALSGTSLALPNASSAASGVVSFGGDTFMHNFNPAAGCLTGSNAFLGYQAGNFTTTGCDVTGIGRQALKLNSSGNDNTGVGYVALAQNTTGSQNTAVGSRAMILSSTGNYNTAIGYQAMNSNSTGSQNTAVGFDALVANGSATNNTGVGFMALYNNTASNNTSFGSYSSYANTTGSWNAAMGYYALRNNTTGNQNIAIGNSALYSNITSNYNTAIGSNAGYSNTSANNTAVGAYAMYNNTAASNSAFGYAAMYSNTTGSGNTALGNSTLWSNTTGGSNTAVGYAALNANTTAAGNTAVGSSALGLNTTGSGNTAVGSSALSSNVVGVNNTALGSGALWSNTGNSNTGVGMVSLGLTTTGSSNSALGDNSLYHNTTGSRNTAVGYIAQLNNNAGNDNTSVGANALQNNTVDGNTAVGSSALQQNTTGYGNAAVGDHALSTNTTGNANTAVGQNALMLANDWQNTAVGYNALSSYVGPGPMGTAGSNTAVGAYALQQTTSYYNTAVGAVALQMTTGSNNTAMGSSTMALTTTGNFNTALGAAAMGKNTTGSSNTVIGNGSFNQNTTGSNNIVIGAAAGSNATTGNYNIYLGHAGVAAEANTIRIGDGTNQSRTFIYGIRGTSTVNNDAVPVLIDSAGQLGTVSSSREVKEDVADMGQTSDRVMKLRPVTFRYRQPYGDGSKPIQYGLIAEEVAETFPELAATGANGKIETVKYHLIPVLLLNEVQRQEKLIGAQQDEIRELRSQLQELRAVVMHIQDGHTVASAK